MAILPSRRVIRQLLNDAADTGSRGRYLTLAQVRAVLARARRAVLRARRRSNPGRFEGWRVVLSPPPGGEGYQMSSADRLQGREVLRLLANDAASDCGRNLTSVQVQNLIAAVSGLEHALLMVRVYATEPAGTDPDTSRAYIARFARGAFMDPAQYKMTPTGYVQWLGEENEGHDDSNPCT